MCWITVRGLKVVTLVAEIVHTLLCVFTAGKCPPGVAYLKNPSAVTTSHLPTEVQSGYKPSLSGTPGVKVKESGQ